MANYSQAGLSLVELMIAMLIGCLLMLATTQLLIDNKRSYLASKGHSENLGNARLLLLVLDQQLGRTGFKRNPNDSVATAFPAMGEEQTGVIGCSFASAQVISPISDKALCIRYQPDTPQDLDCLGNNRPPNSSSLATPYAPPAEAFIEKLALSKDGQLMCTSKGGTASLVEGIADMRFDYGVNTPAAEGVARYTSAPQSAEQIRSVRYTALLRSSLLNVALGQGSLAYSQWNGEQAKAPTDGRLYQTIEGTTALRNLLP